MIHNTIKHLPKAHRISILSLLALLIFVLFWPADKVKASRTASAVTLKVGIKYNIEMPDFAFEGLVDTGNVDATDFLFHKVKRGDTLAKIFSDFNLSPQTTYKVSRAGKNAKILTRLKPGDLLYLHIDQAGQLVSLKYPLNNTETLIVSNNDDKYGSRIETKQIEKMLGFSQGAITTSFWNAGIESGLSDMQIMELAGIFGWDIDFAQEIRSGDTFNIAYETLYVDGEFIGFGEIVSAEFVNQGETFTAVRYTDGWYYTPEGRSMRKSFLRAPINFKYVSSSFNPRRFHPVQKRIKPHRGVDYVARIGTPVMAAGDGKVIRASYDKYNGHHVFIQHGERYQTKYLHFTKRTVKVGQSVKQGQVVGYLGSTGMVTGAHLHYEFLVDGVHRNPRTVSLPKAEPIERSQKAKFTQIANQQVKLLENHKRIMLALN